MEKREYIILSSWAASFGEITAALELTVLRGSGFNRMKSRI
ncbi:MAG: hypothetical protein ACLUEN_00100 [Coprococcus sp.]